MFLIPSHIRKTLGSVLTESPHQGPHTGLILLPHGQVLCSINDGDEDWNAESGRTGASGSFGDEDDSDDEDEDENDVDDESDTEEPYIPTPERNRMLRGIVNTQLLESNAFPLRPSSSSAAGGTGSGGEKNRSSLKIECELGRILAYPLSIPISTTNTTSSSSTPTAHNPTHFTHPDPRLRHLTSIPNLSPQSLTCTLSALGLENEIDRGDHQPSQQEPQAQRSKGKKQGTLVLVLNGTGGLDWDKLERAARTFEKDFRKRLGSEL